MPHYRLCAGTDIAEWDMVCEMQLSIATRVSWVPGEGECVTGEQLPGGDTGPHGAQVGTEWEGGNGFQMFPFRGKGPTVQPTRKNGKWLGTADAVSAFC